MTDDNEKAGLEPRPDRGFRMVTDVLNLPAAPSRVTLKRIEAAVSLRGKAPAKDEITYQHSIFCQTSLPYQDQKDLRQWEQHQGHAHLLLKAGEALDPRTNKWVQFGLPYGTKPRLILTYLNTQAIIKKSPHIDVGDSLTAFVKELSLNINGHTIRMLKEQLTRLSASSLIIALANKEAVRQTQVTIVDEFDLWLSKHEGQRVLWPTTVTLGAKYFESISHYAVPLSMKAVSAIKNSALALDIYCWLAQRLWRVPPKTPHWISWAALKAQFGMEYDRMDHFKEKFRKQLTVVRAVYQDARLDEIPNEGYELRYSPPPVPRRKAMFQLPAAPLPVPTKKAP